MSEAKAEKEKEKGKDKMKRAHEVKDEPPGERAGDLPWDA